MFIFARWLVRDYSTVKDVEVKNSLKRFSV
jgi:hypothetical protein